MTSNMELRSAALRFAIIAVAVMTVLGAGVAAVGATPPSPPHRLFGDVTDNNGNAVAGETIEIVYDGTVVATGMTDESGYYDFNVEDPDTDASNEQLTVRTANYTADATVTWASGGSTGNDFTVERGHQFTGTVTDLDGNALAGKTVEVVYDGSVVESVATSSDGSYHLDVADPDPDATDEQLTVRVSGSDQSADATWEKNAVTETDFTVDTTKPHRFSGTVYDKSGSPVEGAVLKVVYDGTVIKTGKTASDGSYGFDVPNPDRSVSDEQLMLRVRGYSPAKTVTWQSDGYTLKDFTVDTSSEDGGDGGSDGTETPTEDPDEGGQDGDNEDGAPAGGGGGGQPGAGGPSYGGGGDDPTTEESSPEESPEDTPTTTEPTPTTTEPTPEQTTEPMPTTTEPTPTTDVETQTTNDDGQPGFGAVAALVAMLAAALLAVRRHD